VQFGATDVFTPAEFALTDFNTDFSAQATSDNLTDRSFISEKPRIQEPETRNDAIIPPQPKKSAGNTRKFILILVVMGILVFAVSGVGLYVVVSLMNNENRPNENKAAIENINTAQTPETTPSVKENVNLTTGNNEINTGTNVGTNTAANTETTPNTAKKEPQKTPATAAQPTITPTPRIIVEQTPKSTPTIKPTPTAKPTVIKTPSQQGSIKYVVCYVKSENGTIDKIRKNKCSECPAKTACELIFDP
jgi:flagellar basal body-associated protein FliL